MSLEVALKKYFIIHYRQKDAFDRQIPHPDYRIFSYETPELTNGRRRFLATGIEKFLRCYRYIRTGRHFYELIQENIPCRPYFDLEYYREFNQLDDREILNEFIEEVIKLYSEVFEETISFDDFIILESSSESKFSVHLILHTSGLLPNNVCFKSFVNVLCSRLADEQKCIVRDKGKEGFLCDQGVYTKNRNFRMFYSSKCGKKEKLQLADYCNFYSSRGIQKPTMTRVFYDSLIIPNNYQSYSILNTEKLDDVEVNNSIYKMNHNFTRTQAPLDVCNVVTSNGVSPFPLLDNFVLSILRRFCKDVSIRSWTLFYIRNFERRRVQYQFNNCRYCFNKEREHKSQNIYYIVDLDDFFTFQRCFDPDCRHFISNYFSVPEDVKQSCKTKIDSAFAMYGIEKRTQTQPRPSQIPSKLVPKKRRNSVYEPEDDVIILESSSHKENTSPTSEVPIKRPRPALNPVIKLQ